MPLGLIGMLGLIVTIELILGAHASDFIGNPVLLDWRNTGQEASGKEVRRSEVLCFGDSLVKRGIYPPILEALLGRPAFNLAVPAAPPPASYFLLRRALDSGARPNALIVDVHSMMLPTRPGLTAEYWPELLTARELVELSWIARDHRLFTTAALKLAMPTVKHRDAIRAKLLASLMGQESPGAVVNPGLLRNWRVNRGALVPSPRLPTGEVVGSGAGAGDSPKPSGSAAGFASRANDTYVRKFLSLAAARRVPVFWLLPPTSPTYQARSERNGVDAGYAAFVRETQARYTNVVVIDGRRAGYRHEAFSDLTHLNRRGASAFSEGVATLIGPYLAGIRPSLSSRWLELPPYRVPHEVVALEDVEQSIAASRTLDAPKISAGIDANR